LVDSDVLHVYAFGGMAPWPPLNPPLCPEYSILNIRQTHRIHVIFVFQISAS